MIFYGPSFLVLALISRGEETMAPCLFVGVRQSECHPFRLPANVPTVCTHSNYVPFFLAELQHLRIASWECVSLLLPAP